MAGHIKTEVFFPAWSMPLCELSGDDLRKEALSRLKATADGAEDDCRELTQRVDEMLTSGKWRELAATWEEFCVEYFRKPYAFIDAVVESVLVLDANDTSASRQWLKAKTARLCICGQSLSGRAGNRFCSNSCRQRAYRINKSKSVTDK